MALHGKVSPSLDPCSCSFVQSRHGALPCACRLAFSYSFHNSFCSGQLRSQLACKQPKCIDSDTHLQTFVIRSQIPQLSDDPSRKFSTRARFCANGCNSNLLDEDRDDKQDVAGNSNLVTDLSFTDDGQSSGVSDDLSKPGDVGDEAHFEVELGIATSDAIWLRECFFKLVRPTVRLLSGAYLNKPKDALSRSKQREGKPSWSYIKMLTGSVPPGYYRRRIGDKLRQAEADFFTFTSHLGKYLFIMMATGAIQATGYQLAGGDSQEETLLWCSWLAGIVIGSMIGAGNVMEQRCRSGPRNVVITGSTRGLGKALAWEFLLAGDRVVIASRSPESVAKTVEELKSEANLRSFHPFMSTNSHGGTSETSMDKGAKVVGMACDVSKVYDVQRLAEFAVDELGSIDIWINNAGVNKGFRPLVQFSDDDIRQIVSANLIGSLICTREAIRVMKLQPRGGHVFNMDGAGSGGSSTPLTAVYGSTKCGLRQLHASLLKECKRSRVGIHTASPGMVLTDLLLSGASLQNKKMFNIICELPETVARTLVPRMRIVKGTGKAINYLTPPRILLALVTAWLRRGRWFDEEGRAVYAAEADRVRNWAEGRTRFPVSAAIEQFSDTALVSVFSITVFCAFIILSTSENGMPGT